MRAVIIDDTSDFREALKQDLKDFCPDVELVGEASGVVEGVKVLKSAKPDLLFLDIQMQDGSGFDLLEILPEPHPRVVFTTASDAYAVRAFKFSAVDYLLKPIDPDELKSAVDRAGESAEPGAGYQLLRENFDSPKKIALHTQDRIIIVPIQDIVRCESSVNYTFIHVKGEKRILVTKTLKEYDKMLGDFGFLRVHQSHLVNIEHIKEFVKANGGHVVMKDDEKIPVSTRKRAAVIEMISKL